jgi:hypothetical protein
MVSNDCPICRCRYATGQGADYEKPLKSCGYHSRPPYKILPKILVPEPLFYPIALNFAILIMSRIEIRQDRQEGFLVAYHGWINNNRSELINGLL